MNELWFLVVQASGCALSVIYSGATRLETSGLLLLLIGTANSLVNCMN